MALTLNDSIDFQYWRNWMAHFECWIQSKKKHNKVTTSNYIYEEIFLIPVSVFLESC